MNLIGAIPRLILPVVDRNALNGGTFVHVLVQIKWPVETTDD